MIKGMWIGALALVGALLGLRHGWRQQLLDALGCAGALALAWWQYPRLMPYVRAMWRGPALAQATFVYLFCALYGLFHVLAELYAPAHRPDQQETLDTRWIGGLIAAIQVGGLAVLAVTFLADL